ncbi:MAG: hypothetical protein CMM50_03930 [Rhodospirillaceae bacterium]|nr:hypothetical protein [Rhodospirillaceae bacterium]
MLALGAATLAPFPAAAITKGDAERYVECTRMVNHDPKAALADATAWTEAVIEKTDASQAARHCLALAMVALGDYGTAAEGLVRLAGEMGEFPERRLALLRQGGQAWLLAERPEDAKQAFDAALALTPDAPSLLVERARAFAALDDYWAAIDDLNRSLELDPNQDDALVFRGSAYRLLGTPELATTDIERALALNPENVDGLLEKGILLGLDGQVDAARGVWTRIVSLSPQSAAAEAARRNLEVTAEPEETAPEAATE